MGDFLKAIFSKVVVFYVEKMGEEVLNRLNTRRLLWECEKDETP